MLCEIGETCVVQRYVDVEPGPEAMDFACGAATGHNHRGTDIAVPHLKAMRAGTTVVAAAAGVVRGTRDGMADQIITSETLESLQGRDCGNGVAIDHGDGWVTQYCHMAKGSVTVTEGQRVDAGTPLGLIGLSGATEFPHLHFSLRREGHEIDPFDPDEASCADPNPRQLWSDPIAYQPGGVKQIGFSAGIPTYDSIKAGTAQASQLSSRGPALVIWGDFYEAETGDTLGFEIEGPEGLVVSDRIEQAKSQAGNFQAVGRRTPAEGWPKGLYKGRVWLERAGIEIDARRAEILVE